MLKFINEILSCFRPCFSRKAAFGCFATIIIGLMVRSDSLGITSIIRDLALDPSLYHCMGHFFRADSWDWYDIFARWTKTVSRYAPLKLISGRTVLIGDSFRAAKHFGDSLFVLDRYFLTVPLLEEWKACSGGMEGMLWRDARAAPCCYTCQKKLYSL